MTFLGTCRQHHNRPSPYTAQNQKIPEFIHIYRRLSALFIGVYRRLSAVNNSENLINLDDPVFL